MFHLSYAMQNVSKCSTIILILLLLQSSIPSKCQGDEENEIKSAKQPHIVVIVTDDLGWNDVSFNGGNQIQTPNIDSLAYSGLILNKHYAQPICTPSRTAFQTGRYPIRSGMQGWPLRAGEPRGIPLDTTLLPEHLKHLGYTTRLLGKWHVGYHNRRYTPTYRGFDSFFGYYNGYIQYFNHTIQQFNVTGNDLHRDYCGFLNPVFEKGYFTDMITDEAERIIKTHDDYSPLFLQINHLAPHSSDSEEVMEVRDKKETNETFGYIKDYNRRKFAGVVKAMDESVGRIVASLNNAGMLENSIILFMSDNGAMTFGFLENYGSNYPLRGMKFSLFDGGVRVPACLYSPLIKNSQRIVNQLIHVTDWLPTLYAAAGGNPNDLEDIDGVNQWPVFKNDQKAARHSILLNIDEKSGEEGAIIDHFKLLKRSQPLYSSHSGDSGRGEENPEYSVKNVLESVAYQAISNLSLFTISPETIIDLRTQSEVICDLVRNPANCSDYCLFDILNDPCEYKDISKIYPKMVDNLENMINSYRALLVPQTNTDIDLNSDPKYFNGTWMPWINAC